MENKNPLELYIHIPFCVKKCQYCDFLSFAADEETKQRYVEQLVKEIGICGKRMTGQGAKTSFPVISAFIGGGTPSSLDHRHIISIMNAIKENFTLLPEAEITIEANPGTLTADKLHAYRATGINRLSLGLQSANPSELKALGRIHTWNEFLESFRLARAAGFENINIDLMSALPGQSFESYADTLECVVLLEPEHISAYSLIIEEGTPFYEKYASMEEEIRKYGAVRQKDGSNNSFQSSAVPELLPLPDEEEERKMYHYTKEYLAEKGYHRYEISNYSRPGRECVHNRGYWLGTDYLGIGLGAASLAGGERFSVTRDMGQYLALTEEELAAGLQYENRESLTEQEKMEEFMFLGLRLTDGILARDFEIRFGINIEKIYGEIFGKLMEEGLLRMTGTGEERRYQLTGFGLDVSNCVLAEFLL
ncbi:radical SAM family heme chaperone HemW [[Clostridium] symbiosum]|uniref:radical SAM family heme chaperone HemW n=1 Tax=Clostridium symbiosum TaxID=1512 RepID=UPI001D0614EB|nr:radical SAM family heme chaperone HemW [[Clostridium] symbiosum]MCB6608386.1 radical SAM family heme chaperone HemW [[Clostridium] symbiosum]MCB6930600.1 radical SAM family heme chaperone HemW [[Clostridium] symbiosum]